MSEQISALFRRRPNDGWFRFGRYDVTTTDLLCVLAVASMFVYGISRELFNNLVFFAPEVRNGEVWRVVTWPIATEPAIWPLLGIVLFWLFGQQLEAMFGRNRFLWWVLFVTIVPALVLTGLGALENELDFTSFEFGLSTLFLGGIWVYAASYPDVRWFDVIPLWGIAVAFTLLNLLQYSGNGATGAVVFLLVACAVALVAGRSLGLAQAWPIPHIDLTGIGSGSHSRTPRRRKTSKRKGSGSGSRGQRVVDGPWTRTPPAPPAPPQRSMADQAELDALLEKIHDHGIDSLSSGEKQRLNELSKRQRNT